MPQQRPPIRSCSGLLVGALGGESKERLLGEMYEPIAGIWSEHPLSARIAEVACGSFRVKQPPVIKGSGYVVHSLEAALWAFYHADNFEEAILRAVNLDSFLVMRRLGITEAFTNDKHFRAAGFTVLF